MYVIGGSASKTVAEDVSKRIKKPLASMTVKRFPDDEVYIRILDDISGEDVILIQTTHPDKNIIELLLLQDAIIEAGANTINVIIPYFGYGRQDKKFEKGEPISAKAIAEHISLHADKIIIVDPHKEHILDFFSIPAFSCSATSEIAKHLKNKTIDLILAPDKGAIQRAQHASKIIGCDYDYVEKTRVDSQTVKIKPIKMDVNRKKIAIIDDIISTGETMAKSIVELKKQGAKEVLAVCTHGLFANNAKDKLLSAGCDEIISTDTIQNEFSKVKTAPCIIDILKNEKIV